MITYFVLLIDYIFCAGLSEERFGHWTYTSSTLMEISFIVCFACLSFSGTDFDISSERILG